MNLLLLDSMTLIMVDSHDQGEHPPTHSQNQCFKKDNRMVGTNNQLTIIKETVVCC